MCARRLGEGQGEVEAVTLLEGTALCAACCVDEVQREARSNEANARLAEVTRERLSERNRRR